MRIMKQTTLTNIDNISICLVYKTKDKLNFDKKIEVLKSILVIISQFEVKRDDDIENGYTYVLLECSNRVYDSKMLTRLISASLPFIVFKVKGSKCIFAKNDIDYYNFFKYVFASIINKDEMIYSLLSLEERYNLINASPKLKDRWVKYTYTDDNNKLVKEILSPTSIHLFTDETEFEITTVSDRFIGYIDALEQLDYTKFKIIFLQKKLENSK